MPTFRCNPNPTASPLRADKVAEADAVPALSFSGIRHTFQGPGGTGPVAVLDGVSFDVPAREFVAVLGPSGCGKSTLLQMAAGLLAPGSGTVSQRGVPITGVNRAVGFVPQQAQLLPWKTLAENVAFPLVLRGVARDEQRRRVAEAIAAVDLTGFERHYPYQLSGGMQKRASIARTLVYRPDIILMDEPFGALDSQTRMQLHDDLQVIAARAGSSVLLVTHDVTEAVMLADLVVVLSRRPARVLTRERIDLPRPRNVFEPHAVPGFAAAYEAVWRHIRGEFVSPSR
jgi:ABC-type nitrate/sulfonate/bicarbonate transport system ATPase subunit